MKVVDAIAEILKRERIEFLSAYPTTPIIDSAAAVGIRPVLCRQERVGVGIADGFTRTTNGRRSPPRGSWPIRSPTRPARARLR